MTEVEMASLCDVYQTLDPQRKIKKTKTILQTIWRDLSSKFDVLGPYFTSETGFDTKNLIVITQETMLKLHWFGFHTAVIIVDGASSNLSMIKLWTEKRKGAYSVRDEAEDKHLVKPWFVDSFNGHKVYFIICPSHQVKIAPLCNTFGP